MNKIADKMDKKKIHKICVFLLLAVITFILLFPVIITVFTSLKPASEVMTKTPKVLPQTYTLENYQKLYKLRNLPVYIKNSFIVAGLTTFMSLLISSIGAYALSWMRFPGKGTILRIVLLTYMLPAILLILPFFLMCYRLNLIDSRLGLVLTYLSFSLPFSIWMLKNYFESVPVSLIDAGLIDGCSHIKCLTRVILPISLPALSVVVVFSYIVGWNEYLFASILMTTESSRTMSVGLSTLIGQFRIDYGLLTAASIIMLIPVVILFGIVQNYFIDGLVIGATKE